MCMCVCVCVCAQVWYQLASCIMNTTDELAMWMSTGDVAGWQTSNLSLFWHDSCRCKVCQLLGYVSRCMGCVCKFHVNWLHVSQIRQTGWHRTQQVMSPVDTKGPYRSVNTYSTFKLHTHCFHFIHNDSILRIDPLFCFWKFRFTCGHVVHYKCVWWCCGCRWNRFRTLCDSNKKIGVVLELTADLPSEQEIERWTAEPVKAVVVPTSIFISNKKGFPVLSRAHQNVIRTFLKVCLAAGFTGKW